MTVLERPPAFLHQIAPDPSTEAKLAALGSNSPAALLSQIEAGWEAFVRYVGPEAALGVRKRLKSLVFDPRVTEPSPAPGGTGVVLGSPQKAGLVPPRYDIARRDQMWAELQELERVGAPKKVIERARRAFDELVKNH